MTATGAIRLAVPSRHHRPRRAQRLVLAWCERYTRGLPAEVAADRRDELASDLWEQETAGGSRVAASILWRAARGVPADLSWRAARIRSLPADEHPARWWRWSASGAVIGAAVAGLLLVAYGTYALIRVLEATTRHEFLPRDVTILSTAIGTVGALCGLVLLVRARTRWIGALWLALSSLPLLWFGTVALVTLSATVQAFQYRFMGYGTAWRDPLTLASWGVLASAVLFFLALAAAWFPSRHREAEEPR